MSKRKTKAAGPPSMDVTPGQEYRVLSLHPEWAWAIVFGGKDIEYRSWTTKYRGLLLIHASSKGSAKDGYPKSTILGAVDLVDVIDVGPDNKEWVLRNPRQLTQPVADVPGKLQIWRWVAPGKAVRAQPNRQASAAR